MSLWYNKCIMPINKPTRPLLDCVFGDVVETGGGDVGVVIGHRRNCLVVPLPFTGKSLVLEEGLVTEIMMPEQKDFGKEVSINVLPIETKIVLRRSLLHD